MVLVKESVAEIINDIITFNLKAAYRAINTYKDQDAPLNTQQKQAANVYVLQYTDLVHRFNAIMDNDDYDQDVFVYCKCQPKEIERQGKTYSYIDCDDKIRNRLKVAHDILLDFRRKLLNFLQVRIKKSRKAKEYQSMWKQESKIWSPAAAALDSLLPAQPKILSAFYSLKIKIHVERIQKLLAEHPDLRTRPWEWKKYLEL